MLTHDAEYILRVMAKSSNVVVDAQNQRIKPSWKLQRNTLILREIPSDAPEEEVCSLLYVRRQKQMELIVGIGSSIVWQVPCHCSAQ